MKESLEELKAIRDGAPEGWTNVSTRFVTSYFKFTEDTVYVFSGGNWHDVFNKPFGYFAGSRSREDINRIIELMELVGDVAATGFLTPGFDSGTTHKALCRRYDNLLEADNSA